MSPGYWPPPEGVPIDRIYNEQTLRRMLVEHSYRNQRTAIRDQLRRIEKEHDRIRKNENAAVDRARIGYIERTAPPPGSVARRRTKRALPVPAGALAVGIYRGAMELGIVNGVQDNPIWLNCVLGALAFFWFVWFMIHTVMGRTE